MSQFQPLQFSMPGGGGRGRERDQRYAGAVAICAPFPLGGVASGEPGPGAFGLETPRRRVRLAPRVVIRRIDGKE